MTPILFLATLAAFLILVASAEFVPPQSPRSKYNFNSDWKIHVGDSIGAQQPGFDVSKWKSVTLPHAWNEDDAFAKDITNLSTGIAWYRKIFSLPATTAGTKVFLEFEGIRHAGEFWVNGKPIGLHENGVMAFGFDVTNFINAGGSENVVSARIDNSWSYHEKESKSAFQWNDRNFYANYGGINKNVYLHITGELYQTLALYSNLETVGTYVYASEMDITARTAVIIAESEVRNDLSKPATFKYYALVANANETIVKTLPSREYTLGANKTHIVRTSDTLTNVDFWSWGYGYLYDVSTVLEVDGVIVDIVKTRTGFRKTAFEHGMFKLNDRTLQLKGYAQRTTNEWPALGSAVPAWMSQFSNQLMLDSNANLVRWMHVTPWKQDDESCDRIGLLQALPAGDSEKDVGGRRWAQRMELMRDAIIYNRNSPSVVFYEAGNKGISEEHMEEMKGLRQKFDPHGGRAMGSREMLNSSVAEYGGEMLYVNKGARQPFWAMEYSRDEALRKYWDSYSPPFHTNGEGPSYKDQGSGAWNHNQDSHAIENVARWYDYFEARPGTGRRVSAGGVNIVFSDSNTHYRGPVNYRTSGEVDAMRLLKEGWWAHKVMWNGWVDVERPGIHIISHWNYGLGIQKDVHVVSSLGNVSLQLNGKSVGAGSQSHHFLHTFKNVSWQPGELKAIAVGPLGNPVAEDVRLTVGSPVAVQLKAIVSPAGFRADGQDIAMVDVEVVDSKGKRCPTALDLIDFTLSGPADWRGGIAVGEGNYILSKSVPVENGINRVMIRSRTTPGTITLTAKSGNLTPQTIELETKRVNVVDGLSLILPNDNLPLYLNRGPTPPGESFKMTRQPLDIAQVRAASNPAAAKFSIDDDESTSWQSGDSGDAWIEYHLQNITAVNQLVMKVSGHRSKTYPIKVMVDRQEAFSGTTPANLGYATVYLKGFEGKIVRVESRKGRLSIVEAELYG